MSAKEITAKVFNGIGYLGCLCVIAIVALNTFLGFGGVKIMHVVSDSMVPTFSKGDAILVSTRMNDSVAVGEMIAYKATWLNNNVVTHRVVKIDDDGQKLVTKGDHNAVDDPEFNRSQMVGKILAIYPHMGTVFSPTGIFILAVLGVGGMIVGGLLGKNDKTDQSDEDENLTDASDVVIPKHAQTEQVEQGSSVAE